MLIEDLGEQQAAFQYGDLLIQVLFCLGGAIQPVFNFDVFLYQRVNTLSRINQLLTQLLIQSLLFLNKGRQCLGIVSLRSAAFFYGFFGQGQTFIADLLLQQLYPVIQLRNLGGEVITLLIVEILLTGIVIQIFLTLFLLQLQQRQLGIQFHTQ